MPQGSPKSVTAVNRPVTLSTNYSHNAPTLTRQHTWTNENTAPTCSYSKSICPLCSFTTLV